MPLLTMLLVVLVLGALLLGVLAPRQSGLALKVGATGVALITCTWCQEPWARFDSGSGATKPKRRTPRIRLS